MLTFCRFGFNSKNALCVRNVKNH